MRQKSYKSNVFLSFKKTLMIEPTEYILFSKANRILFFLCLFIYPTCLKKFKSIIQMTASHKFVERHVLLKYEACIKVLKVTKHS